MKKDIIEKLADLDLQKAVLDTLEEKLDKQAKEAEAYENEFKKKNKIYKAFCDLKVKDASVEEAEDFACRILGCVLAKKTVDATSDEIKEIFEDLHNRIMEAIVGFREHYSLLLAWGALSKKQMKSKND